MLSARAVRETCRLPAHIDVSKQNIWKMLSSLIFDMDGTLSNSDPVHMQAFRDYLEPEGILVDDDFYRTKISGRTNAAIFSELFPDRPEGEIERRADEKEAMFRLRYVVLFWIARQVWKLARPALERRLRARRSAEHS